MYSQQDEAKPAIPNLGKITIIFWKSNKNSAQWKYQQITMEVLQLNQKKGNDILFVLK